MKNKTRFAAGAAACCVLLSMTACRDEKKVLESSKEDQVVVMTVSGYEIPLEIYRYVALNYKKTYEAGETPDIWLGESGAALLNELNEDVEESLIGLYATLAMCGEYGIQVDDSYVTDTLDIMMDNIYEEYDYDYEAYAAAIAEYNMNDSVYRFIVRNDILAEELLQEMVERGEIPVDDETLQAVFDSDDFIRVKQILVASDNGKTPEENLAYAQELLARAESGEDFDALIHQYGEDLFMFNNSDGYYFARGHLHRSFEDAAFDLAIGEISGIVESAAGYSIIKRYEKDPAYIKAHFDDLCEEYIDGQYNLALEKYAEGLSVSATDELKNYSIFTLADTKD
ncbi:MAG: peptidylprolyl isomerase [Eubacteriales bacterium]